ncbi:peptidylprolyl isomerase [Lacinutrix iliipiscaria]|uniref:Peptidyl-prolyl cis-trans isomerase n=1 Tax=Lacinutrix iliipiscaria TaxID=1230532 RepID=A0ABW5WNN2_9FLAO
MRLFIICLACLFVFNCEDNITEIKKTSPTAHVYSEAKKDIQKDTFVEPIREFPYLTDKNALDFFSEYGEENKESIVRITTYFGKIDIKLFNETKYHRANFIFLTKQAYFDNTQFYRVIDNFIIQGGNTDDIDVLRKRRKIGKYLLPTDTNHGLKHHRGMVSMPSRDVENPHKLASPYQFFIVQKKDGAYHLDGNYTIFGEVIKGMNVVDEIAKQKTDNADWPLSNVYIKKVEVLE